MQDSRVRAVLLFVLALAFGVLIFGGVLIHRDKPPVPERVATQDGRVLFTGDDIKAGQRHYFTRGGQHMGSIWGHGSYLAPDWSADYLHRIKGITITPASVAATVLIRVSRFRT